MSWEERIKAAAYVSPSGVRSAFAWVSLSRETQRRTTPFEAVDGDGVYMQENGYGARSFPMRCIFHGPDCDLEASEFEEALIERGVGRLEHPLYGDFEVVPNGSIKRTDEPTTEGNQSIVEVTFIETTLAVFPSSQTYAPGAVSTATIAVSQASGAELAAALDLTTVPLREFAKGTIVSIADRTTGALLPLASSSKAVRRAFTDSVLRLRQSLDALMDDPALLASSITSMMSTPVVAALSMAQRLDAYESLIDGLMTSPGGRPGDALTGTPQPRRTAQVGNAWRLTDVSVLAALGACVRASTLAEYSSRNEAITIAGRLLTLFGTVSNWRDAGYSSLLGVAGYGLSIDTGGALQALRDAVTSAAGHLIALSFGLAVERRIVLTESRTLLSLVAELYGQTDEVLDFFIESNSLTGSEILELPAGREIVYFTR